MLQTGKSVITLKSQFWKNNTLLKQQTPLTIRLVRKEERTPADEM
jgi:hypothetical protein